jgi:hypothetical protein
LGGDALPTDIRSDAMLAGPSAIRDAARAGDDFGRLELPAIPGATSHRTGDAMLEERKSALLLLINFALLVVLLVAAYYGALTVLWRADVLKLSFVLIVLFFATGFGIAFNLIGDELADTIEGRLPMIALCGTVYGILSVFQVLAGAKLGSAADFKTLIGPLLAGGGTAMWPTFLALLGSNLLWAQILIRRAEV